MVYVAAVKNGVVMACQHMLTTNHALLQDYVFCIVL